MDPISLVAGALGLLITQKLIYGIRGDRLLESTREEARLLLERARLEAQNLNAEAELKFREERLQLQTRLEEQIQVRQTELKVTEQLLQNKETRLEQRLLQLESRESECNTQKELVDKNRQALDESARRLNQELERISSLTVEQATELLLKRVEDETREQLDRRLKLMLEQAREDARSKAAYLISQTVQKVSIDYKSENLVTVVPIPSEETKGRIIGREGRNIRAFEQITGIDVIIDDTPDVVVLSGFNALRRVIATRTLERLIADGRIHPSRIEEIFQEVQKEVDEECFKAGEDAALRAGVHRLNRTLIQELGKLKFRTSYGQNVLEHSIECSQIAGIMAAEIGENAKLAKRAALLHDVGKILDGDDASHAALGAELARKCGEKPAVVNAIAAHHEEVPMDSPLAFLTAAADAISASRRGARFGQTENYVERLENLENVARSFPGVQQAYAVQAGREVRVLVSPEQVDDTQAVRMSHEIVQRIESELDYPGQIKVVVVRENRFVDYAF